MGEKLKQASWTKPTAPDVPAKQHKTKAKVEKPEQQEAEVNHG